MERREIKKFPKPVQFPIEPHCHTRSNELLVSVQSLREKTCNKKNRILKAKITAQNE